MKLDIILWKYEKEIKVLLKSDKNNHCWTRGPVYICDNI